MVHYSVLVPERNSGDAFARQLPELCRVLDQLVLSYEIICIDDGSDAATQDILESLFAEYSQLRVLRFEERAGISAALTAGIEAAAGEILIAVAPGSFEASSQIPHLVSRLSRGDLVHGRRPRGKLAKFWERISRLPRWLLLGLEVKDPDCLFWAARREAVEGLQLARGMFRYLPSLVSMRGFRVTEVNVDFQNQPYLATDARPNPIDLLSIWWLKRRWQPRTAHELAPADAVVKIHPTAGTQRVPRRKSA